ncbi:hypothetical protein [Rubrivirga sp.]|uniref:hypothetical protein n=1 Tax=Rubrivirga sp. TaxID=1885344 RepID=UPI003B51AA57
MRPAPHSVTVRLDLAQAVDALVGLMVGAAVLTVFFDVWLHLGGGLASADLAALFDATSERGLGSWLSVTQTVLVALTLWGVVAVVRQSGGARRRVLGWAVLAVFFSYLAFDDGTRLHERVGSAFGASGASETGLGAAFPSYYWQLVFGPVFAGVGLFMAAFLWRELRTARLRGLVGVAFGLMAVAVGLDFVDGLGDGHPWDLYGRLGARPDLASASEVVFGMSGPDAVVHLSRAVEESVEMAAMTLLWAVFLTHLGALAGGVRVVWSPVDPRAARRARSASSDREPVPQPDVSAEPVGA